MHAQAGCFVQVEETEQEAASVQESCFKALEHRTALFFIGSERRTGFSEFLFKMIKPVLCGENLHRAHCRSPS